MAAMLSFPSVIVINLLVCFSVVLCKPEQGLFVVDVDKEHHVVWFAKSMYKDTQISVSITCEGKETHMDIQWTLRRSPCAQEFIDVTEPRALSYLLVPGHSQLPATSYSKTEYLSSSLDEITCSKGRQFYMHPYNYTEPTVVYFKPAAPFNKTKGSSGNKLHGTDTGNTPEGSANKEGKSSPVTTPKPVPTKKQASDTAQRRKRETDEEKSIVTPAPKEIVNAASPSQIDIKAQKLLKVWQDGYYLLVLSFVPSYSGDDAGSEKATFPDDFQLQVTVRMVLNGNYIGAVDWPLLIFYGIMGLVYVGYGIFWLVMLACNWRDLLRVQFWIGGVILLGMLEKAVFFAEYENLNQTGQSVRGAIILAELVSCLKRSLARMLIIIVSLGFGIIKPRLGQTLHKVLITGVIYMILGSIEGCMRALSSRSDQSREMMAAAVPLAVTDAIICWWIFSSLLQTTRTLRLRRNVVKLSLYRHFTNTLIFAVVASIAYMIWFMTQHRFKECLTDWKELWVDEAFWHLLFSVILFIIMILWRPTVNNMRYAFSPLLDAAEDDVDDEDLVMSEAYEGMKMRSTKSQIRNGSPWNDKKVEDDLKWVEENIPSSLADKVLPALDSDEEIMNTKFEVSKME